MLLFSQLVILFFIFSILGWLMEVVLKYIKYHRFINRGFLVGPYCPIYGFGVVFVTVLVGDLIGYEGTYFETFGAGFIICGILEYFTSWYMEKMFHARWWDYSNKPMNLYGRIWIGNLIAFGAASVVIIKFIAPRYFNFISTFSPFIVKLVAIIIILVMIVDFIASHFLMEMVKKEIDNQEGDNTEVISTQIHALLKNKNLLIRRIHEAYPNLDARPKALTLEFKKAKHEYKHLNKEFKKAHKKFIKAVGYERDRLEKACDIVYLKRQGALSHLREVQRKFFKHDEN